MQPNNAFDTTCRLTMRLNTQNKPSWFRPGTTTEQVIQLVKLLKNLTGLTVLDKSEMDAFCAKLAQEYLRMMRGA